jgi:response regulator of citrate/malate metabolism
MISVVILEDDPIFRDMLLDMLPKATIKTNLLATCSTIRQAKEAIEQFSPQLVLLDVELPDGKGMELLTHYDEFGTFETIFHHFTMINMLLMPLKKMRLIIS